MKTLNLLVPEGVAKVQRIDPELFQLLQFCWRGGKLIIKAELRVRAEKIEDDEWPKKSGEAIWKCRRAETTIHRKVKSDIER